MVFNSLLISSIVEASPVVRVPIKSAIDFLLAASPEAITSLILLS